MKSKETNCTLFFYKNIVFPAKAEYFYSSADFRLKIFLCIFLDYKITAYDISILSVLGHQLQLK